MYTIVIMLMLVTVTLQEDEDVFDYEPLPDYYAILKVSPTADVKEIKKSFRKLAMQFHPDKNKEEGAQEKFQELSEAYSILGDAEKRAEYDELYMDEAVVEEEAEPESSESSEPLNDDSTKETETNEDSSEEKDVWGDLDDETLYKVLKFLADNDYEISKKKTVVNREPEDSERYGDSFDHYNRFQRRSTDQSRHTFEAPHHKYTFDAQNKIYNEPRVYTRPTFNSNYSNGFCRTTIRWEGDVKVTSRSCY